MARASAPFHHANNPFSILGDTNALNSKDTSSSPIASPIDLTSANVPSGILKENSINVVQNLSCKPGSLQSPSKSPLGVLAVDFEKLHLASPAHEGKPKSAEKPTPRRLRLRPTIGSKTFEPPKADAGRSDPSEDSPAKSKHQLEPIEEEASQLHNLEDGVKDHPLMHLPPASIPSLEDQVARHQAGQYDIRLSYPATIRPDPSQPSGEDQPPRSDGKKIIYGCNFVRRDEIPPASLKTSSGIADTVFVIASPVALADEEVLREEPKVLVDQMSSTTLETPPQPSQPQTPQKAVEYGGEAQLSPCPLDGSNMSVGSAKSVSSPAPRTTQIEDSVEALDRLEEELEAVNAVARFGRVVSPEVVQPAKGAKVASKTQQKPGVKRTASTTKRSQTKPATVRVKSTETRLSPGKARSISVGPEARNAKDGEESSASKPSPARKPVARPASLAPPKPLVKSNRPRTLPTFELPGESISRRLKEQREARLSMQVSPEQAAKAFQQSLPQRAKSTKAPTRPTFELPGEAISRRKREQREVRIKAEQEEERKRREFKARPIPTSFAPNTMPRETIASRARQNKMAHDENAGKTSNGMKRLSVAGPPQAATNGSPQFRGRATAIVSSQVSRAASSSTGSVSGKHSTLSAEDAHQLKLRGREIYERDNRFTEDKERERREREAIARLAREQAAERSRQASREWAEKQRRKAQAQTQANVQAGTAGTAGSPS